MRTQSKELFKTSYPVLQKYIDLKYTSAKDYAKTLLALGETEQALSIINIALNDNDIFDKANIKSKLLSYYAPRSPIQNPVRDRYSNFMYC